MKQRTGHCLPNPKKAEQIQTDKFKEAVRQAGAKVDEAAFEDKLKRISEQKPKKETPDK